MSKAKRVFIEIKKHLKESNKGMKKTLKGWQKIEERYRAEMVARLGQQMTDSNKKDGCNG